MKLDSTQRSWFFLSIAIFAVCLAIYVPYALTAARGPTGGSALGLAFGCGVLALLSIAATAGNVSLMSFLLRGHGSGFIRVVGFVVMKAFAIAASIAIFFLIYWVLPNGKVPARAVLPTAVIMGLLSEALKYGYILALPWLNFAEVYGPFALSVSMMFWAFLTGLLLLAGANLSAEEHLRHGL